MHPSLPPSLPPSHSHRFVERLRPSLVAIRGVRRLCAEVELERRKRYNQDDQEHEKMLMTVGGVAGVPGCRGVCSGVGALVCISVSSFIPMM